MGIDYGSKKIGIAMTDEAGVMAFPKEVVPNDKNFFTYLSKQISDEQIREIVIGHSLNNDGEPNQIHSAVEDLMMTITLHLGLPVHLEPEQYSTQQAAQVQGKHKLIDASAAALILDSYITKQNNHD